MIVASLVNDTEAYYEKCITGGEIQPVAIRRLIQRDATCVSYGSCDINMQFRCCGMAMRSAEYNTHAHLVLVTSLHLIILESNIVFAEYAWWASGLSCYMILDDCLHSL